MKTHPWLRNRFAFWLYLVLVVVETMFNILCLYPVSEEIGGMAIIPLLWGNLFFALFLPLLWFYIRFVHFDQLPVYIRLINKHLPGIFILGITAATSLGIAYWMDVEALFLQILPVELFIWILLYVVAFQYWQSIAQTADEEEEQENGVKECVPQTELLNSFAVKHGKQLHVIAVKDILYLQAYGDYVTVVSSQGKFLKEQTLKYFEAHLSQELFVRVHRSYIVNIRAIASIERYGKEQYMLSLHNKEKIKATANGYKRLKERLKL